MYTNCEAGITSGAGHFSLFGPAARRRICGSGYQIKVKAEDIGAITEETMESRKPE